MDVECYNAASDGVKLCVRERQGECQCCILGRNKDKKRIKRLPTGRAVDLLKKSKVGFPFISTNTKS